MHGKGGRRRFLPLLCPAPKREAPVLKEDFYNSLLAAFEPGEIEAQLREAGLGALQIEQVSDRHLAVWGRAPGD